MGFPAVMPGARCIGRLGIPFNHSQGRTSALNHKPVIGLGGYSSADLTTEFFYRRHKLVIVSCRPNLFAHSQDKQTCRWLFPAPRAQDS